MTLKLSLDIRVGCFGGMEEVRGRREVSRRRGGIQKGQVLFRIPHNIENIPFNTEFNEVQFLIRLL